ncbi:N-formylglutamate amidohydrolase [Salipaludibacillus neizhouensis]|uniref:N-formylglutamate amidohydrolase n=2 Tax=Salipaludibacillus neizhouensis TaxID=885475 RepID=A0A3A9JZM3_9BACI|nr:N-formylglutamate amidohydrolase [Salipaludibacillus neizhouensis]
MRDNDTMTEKLPILISVPHAGMKKPAFIQTTCLLTDMDILLDGDTWTDHLFAFNGRVEEFHQMDVSRIFLDLNREETDLPPLNPDGIVKTRTVTGKKVWDTPSGLRPLEREKLIQDYYLPYHRKLEKAARNPKVKVAIDCHSMLDYGPGNKLINWQHRPLFCIGNRGTTSGEQGDEDLTAPVEMVVKLKRLLEKKFQRYKTDSQQFVTMNDPFKGGFVTRHHGALGEIPWIQLEVNRNLYLPEREFMNLQPSESQKQKLGEFREMLYDVLLSFSK